MRLYGLFASCISCARFVWGSETFEGRFEQFARPARYLYFWVLWRWRKPVSSIWNIPKQRKITKKWKQNTYSKRPTWHNTLKLAKSSSAFGQRSLLTSINDSLSSKSFFHHHESVHKVGRNTEQDVLRYPVRKKVHTDSRRKVDLWPFDPKFDM